MFGPTLYLPLNLLYVGSAGSIKTVSTSAQLSEPSLVMHVISIGPDKKKKNILKLFNMNENWDLELYSYTDDSIVKIYSMD